MILDAVAGPDVVYHYGLVIAEIEAIATSYR
jgi:hypothetical protein